MVATWTRLAPRPLPRRTPRLLTCSTQITLRRLPVHQNTRTPLRSPGGWLERRRRRPPRKEESIQTEEVEGIMNKISISLHCYNFLLYLFITRYFVNFP